MLNRWIRCCFFGSDGDDMVWYIFFFVHIGSDKLYDERSWRTI